MALRLFLRARPSKSVHLPIVLVSDAQNSFKMSKAIVHPPCFVGVLRSESSLLTELTR
jgi:hypothetical protein